MNFTKFHKTKRINITNVFALKIFSDELTYYINSAFNHGYKNIIFTCIGTDRITGDSLGPIIGHKICGLKHGNIFVHGNLENPVHAKNLYEEMNFIYNCYEDPFIFVIDACLGDERQIGDIIIGEGSIKPGAGVKKVLAPVGDAYIMGVVNTGGFMEFQTLQNTRLNTVMKIADVITNGIKYTLWKINAEKAVSNRYIN